MARKTWPAPPADLRLRIFASASSCSACRAATTETPNSRFTVAAVRTGVSGREPTILAVAESALGAARRSWERHAADS